MRKWAGRILPIFLICAVSIVALSIGTIYFGFISRRIYEDSSDHLEEIYGQVNRSFGAFMRRNWGLLESWEENSALTDSDKGGGPDRFIDTERKYWGFSDFYFLSKAKEGMSVDGTEETMELGDAWDLLMGQREPVMAGETLSDGQDATVFAIPVEHGNYGGFGYDAIAICYTNADLAASLNVDAFSGQGRCFLIHNDGTVLLSAQAGDNVSENYLAYLKTASDLDEEDLARMQSDWQNGSAGFLQCNMDGVSHCILYQPMGYQDYFLLSVVPQNAVSAGFLSVQKTTVYVLIVIFLMLTAALIFLIVLSSRSQLLRNRLELQYRERMFDVLSNNVDDIFIMLNEGDYHVDYVSPNIERLLGLPVKEVRGNIKALEKCAMGRDIIIPREELESISVNDKKNWEYEYMHQTTGERRFYRMTAYRMNIQNMAKYIVVLSDRTQERQMNQQLQEALTAARSANEAKSNFLSNMSHDIRTPMNAIVGFSMLLEKDADNAEKVREYIRKITASSHHLLSLINDVLDMSKIESGKTSLNVERFSLPELMEELSIILMPQAKAKKQDFRILVQGTPPEQIVGDKLRLNQILINLLSNAIKYTQDGGAIRFTVCELPNTSPQYVELRFVVKDNGIGMSEEFQKYIFAPFSREISSVTNKVQGTGLGMAITKNLVDLMGGVINVESAPGEGSTFTVELSFALPEQEEQGEAWHSQNVTRILVADDEEEVCLDVKEMMRDTGVEVSYATEGAAAVEMAVLAHRQGRDYDVILLDWKMPGMNGVETARRIRDAVKTEIPILVLTSYDWSEIEEEAREAGINAFMPKPFFVSTFWQTIKPMFTDHEETKQTEAGPAERVMEGRRFLVAEDNELNAEILTEMLRREGADSELAQNGEEAVEMFERSAPGHYDMILMDVQMPVMNGYEATRRIRAGSHPEAGTVPIAAMTANTFAEDVHNALDAGMDGHLAKPIDMDAVRELVGRLLSRRDGNKAELTAAQEGR